MFTWLRVTIGLLLLCFVGACGDGATTDAVLDPADANPPRTQAEAIAELETLPTPRGVDDETFQQLKSALGTMLASMPAERFVSTPPTGPANRITDLTTGIDDAGNEGIQWNYRNVGDLDFNGEVNISDLVPIGQHFGKDSSAPDWKTSARFADADENGEVNISDVTPLGANFFHHVAGYLVQSAATAEGPFSDLGSVSFEDGAALLTGIRMFHFLPAVQSPVYRVVPRDGFGILGEPSAISIDFLISDDTRVVGAEGGPSFVERNGDELTLLLPDGGGSPIAVGDVVVGAEEGGYLLRATEVQQSGNEVNIVGEPAILADVFLQGGLSEAMEDLSQVPVEVYTFSLDGQVLCDTPELFAEILDGTVSFLPQADVAVNYNQYGGVTYLRGLVLGGPLNVDMTVRVVGDDWSGIFPPTPEDVPFYEHKMTGFTFDFTAYQNGVPVTMALQYDVFVGIRGSGDIHGTYIARVISSYDDIRMGGVFDSTGIADFNEYTAGHGTVDAPVMSAVGGDFEFAAYVRPEIHTRLYGNPVPGNTEDLALTLAPQLLLSGERTDTPEPGYNYFLEGSMDTSYLLELHHIGMADEPQFKVFTGQRDILRSGFLADFDPPH